MKVKLWKFLFVCVLVLYAVHGSEEHIEITGLNFNFELKGSYNLIPAEDSSTTKLLKTYRKVDTNYYLSWDPDLEVQDWTITLRENDKPPLIIAKRWYEKGNKIEEKETLHAYSIQNVDGKDGSLAILPIQEDKFKNKVEKNEYKLEPFFPKDHKYITDKELALITRRGYRKFPSRKNVNVLLGSKNWIFFRDIEQNKELSPPKFEKITMRMLHRKTGFKDKRTNLIDYIVDYSIHRGAIIQKTITAFVAASNYYVDSKNKETWNEQIISEVQETIFKFMQIYELISEQYKGKKYSEYKKSFNDPQRKKYEFHDPAVVQEYLVEHFYLNHDKTTVDERERLHIILSMVHYSKYFLQRPEVIKHLKELANNTSQSHVMDIHEENNFEIHFEDSFMKIIPINTEVNDFGIDNFPFQPVTIFIEKNYNTDTQGKNYMVLKLRLMFQTDGIDVAMFYPDESINMYGLFSNNNECILRFKSDFLSYMMDPDKDIKPYNISSCDREGKLEKKIDDKFEEMVNVKDNMYNFEDPFGEYSYRAVEKFDDILDVDKISMEKTITNTKYYFDPIFDPDTLDKDYEYMKTSEKNHFNDILSLDGLDEQSIEDAIEVQEYYDITNANEDHSNNESKNNQMETQKENIVEMETQKEKANRKKSLKLIGADDNFIESVKHLDREVKKTRKPLSKIEKEKLLNAYKTANQYLHKKINYEYVHKKINDEDKSEN